MYTKVVKFSFTQQKIFWVLVFSFMYLVSVDPMDRSFVNQNEKKKIVINRALEVKRQQEKNHGQITRV